ncbi:MAG: hypothetical protein ACFFCV_07100 [Promethearchaeota archaeon]
MSISKVSMKRTKFGLTFLLIFILIFGFPQLVKAFYSYVIHFEIDKDSYYLDEKIHVNASWYLEYNPANEISYLALHICDLNDDILWMSEEITDQGTIEQNWSVNILDLDFDSYNFSSISLKVRLFIFYFQIDTTNTMMTYLRTVRIDVVKKNVSCELEGFDDYLTYGETLSFTARFYDSVNSSNLTSRPIDVKIVSNDITTFQNAYVTNSTGRISLIFSSLNQLAIGINQITFTIENETLYNGEMFYYEVLVNKLPIFIDILSFEEVYTNPKDIEIILFYYYNTKTPLENVPIKIHLYNGSTLLYENEQNSNNLGMFTIVLTENLFNLENIASQQEFRIEFTFEGTEILETKTLLLNFTIEINEIINNNSSNIQVIVSITTTLMLGFLGVILFINREKIKKRFTIKKLMELTVRR